MVPTVLGIVTITFVLIHLAPNDPALDLAGEGADQAQIDAARAYLGLDRSLPEQYVTYLRRLFTGDFGESFVHRRPVLDLIRERLPATLALTGSALLVSTAGGLAIGLLAGGRLRRRSGAGLNVLALVAYSLPVFWLAQLAIFAFALTFEIFPASGIHDARASFTGVASKVDFVRHLVLPALVLSVSEVALLARVARAAIIAEAGKVYLRAARARGLSEREALTRHAFRNALLPVITVIGSRIGFLVSGAVLVETVFAWPGLGRLLVEAGQVGDQSVILGMVLLVSLTVVVANVLTDIAYARADPRISYR